MLYLMAPSIAWSRLTPLLGLGPRRVRCKAKRSGHPASHRDTEGHRINPTASCRRACPISRLTRPVGRQYKLHPARRRSSDQARPHALSIAPCKTTLWQQRLQTRKSLTAGGARTGPPLATAGNFVRMRQRPRPEAKAPLGRPRSTMAATLEQPHGRALSECASASASACSKRHEGVGPFERHLSRNRFRNERLPLSRRRHLALGAVALAPVGSSAPFWVAGNVGPH